MSSTIPTDFTSPQILRNPVSISLITLQYVRELSTKWPNLHRDCVLMEHVH